MSSAKPTYRAVLVGINYIGTSNALAGCINDVKNVAKFLQEKMGFLSNEITILTDDQAKSSALYPSKANMIAAFKKAVAEITKAGDVLVVHYSGHGSYQRQSVQKRRAGDEDDGRDEVLCPVDFNTAGFIVDDDLRKMLVDPLPEGAILRVLFDQCHSATALDLRYTYTSGSTLPKATVVSKSKNTKIPACKADVKSLSAARDIETAADARIDGAATGAFTYAVIKTLKSVGLEVQCGELLNAVNKYMVSNRYTQRPVLCSGLKEDIAATSFFFKLVR